MHSWLNGTFLNTAFTAEEQKGIRSTKIVTKDYGKMSGGDPVWDKVWLLSNEEAEKYFKTDAKRTTDATYYVANDWRGDQGESARVFWTSSYWLRSPGEHKKAAIFVRDSGELDDHNKCVYDYMGVRPAMWLDLNKAYLPD